jgi:hypothetical protein
MTIEAAELLVSELVTNACKFASPSPETSRSSSMADVGIIDVVLGASLAAGDRGI